MEDSGSGAGSGGSGAGSGDGPHPHVSEPLGPDIAVDILPRSDDAPHIRVARAQLRCVELVQALHEHQQLPEKGKDNVGWCETDRIPAANCVFTCAMLQAVLRHYGIPFRVCTGYMTHPCLKTDAGRVWQLYCWLESPLVYPEDTEWPDEFEMWPDTVVTDACLTGWGAKRPQILGKMMGPEEAAMADVGANTTDLAVYSKVVPASDIKQEPPVPIGLDCTPLAFMSMLALDLEAGLRRMTRASPHVLEYLKGFKARLDVEAAEARRREEANTGSP